MEDNRLVQDFTKRGLLKEHRRTVLKEALDWVKEAFTGDPEDVRTWPVLDPLSLHALTLAHKSDEAGIAEPTAHLYNDLGSLFRAKARYAEAEPLHRRPHHPNVATRLNNLAELLRDANCLVEAEPLIRRALAITEGSRGPNHFALALYLNNLGLLLKATNRVAEAEPWMRHALASHLDFFQNLREAIAAPSIMRRRADASESLTTVRKRIFIPTLRHQIKRKLQ